MHDQSIPEVAVPALKTASRFRKYHQPWIPSLQGWTWIITIVWMTIANIWKPFGLYGFVCMFTPIVIALSGRGKMHCARICPRGSFINTFTKRISLHLPKPAFMGKSAFRWTLWGLMMGSFIILIIYAIPRGVAFLGNTVLVFMEIATALAFLFGVLFSPRAWCTVCPMGFTTGNLRALLDKAGRTR
jgi:hypothetical protein